MLVFFVLFALAIPFPTLYVLAVLEVTQSEPRRRNGLILNPRVSTPRRLEQFTILSQRSSTQLAEQMEFAESNVPASVSEFQAVILAGYGNA